jgi:protein ImuB
MISIDSNMSPVPTLVARRLATPSVQRPALTSLLWIALHLPKLPLEALLRGSPLPEAWAIVEHHRIVACDGKARARGVRSGMSVSAALALAPQLRVRQRDASAETEALLGIAAWAMQFTPNVALEFPDAVLLEVSGSLKLFGGLTQILGDVREGLAAMGFTASLAVAPTSRAAGWLACAGQETLVTDAVRLDEAVSALPVAALRCDSDVLDALEAIGVATLGDLLTLPRDGLARRFGQTLLENLDRACGQLPDPRTFFMPPAQFSARIELLSEVTQAEALLFAARLLLLQLAGYLAARSGGVQRLVLKLAHRDGGTTAIAIGLVAPSRDAEHFTVLVRERLRSVALREPVHAIAVEATDILPFAEDNLGLFPDDTGPGNWERLVERLRTRLGTEAGHIPPTGTGDASTNAEPDEKQLQIEFGERPFWLLDAPRPIAEVGAVPDYEGPLTLLAGPERIESGWWDDDDIARDYFVARTSAESLVWIYRERRGGGWYLHGLFA